MRSVYSTFLITVICTAVLGCAAEPDYQSWISRRTSFGFADTRQAAESRLKTHPQHGTAWAVLALAYGNGGDYLGMGSETSDLKESALSQAIRFSPKSPYTRAAFGLVRMATAPDQAELQLQQCIDETPEFLECHNLYGDLLRKTGRPNQAETVYLDALQQWPNDGELLVSYALLLQETGRVEAASMVLRKLIEEQPEFPRGYWHLATLLYETRADLVEARQMATRALDLDPLIWNGEYFLRLLDEAEQ